MEIVQLAEMNDSARDELSRRSAEAQARLEAGKTRPGDAALFATVCTMRSDFGKLLATFDSLLAKDRASSAVRELLPFVMPGLLESKRYAEIAELTDIDGRVGEILEAGKTGLNSMAGSADPEMIKMMRLQTVGQAAQYYQVLLALGRVDDARALDRRILAFDASPDAKHLLAWEAYLSGKPLPENLDYARLALRQSSEEEKVAITDTLARLLFTMDRKQEAIALCEKAMAEAKSDQDRWILSECLADFEKGMIE
jgi:tetratricopeptide (TPR) repeat protein